MRTITLSIAFLVVASLTGCTLRVPATAIPFPERRPPPAQQPPPPPAQQPPPPAHQPPPPPAQQPPPPPPQAKTMTYDEAVSRGMGECRARGYACSIKHANLTGDHIWKVKMDVTSPAKGHLDLDLDARSYQIVKAKEDLKHDDRGKGNDDEHERGHGKGKDKDKDDHPGKGKGKKGKGKD